MNNFKRIINTTLAFILLCLSTNTIFAKSVNFAVVSDIHYKTDKNSQNYSTSEKALYGFTNRTKENKYDFIVFLGDNIDKSKQNLLGDFLDSIKNINTPYYIVMGDSDVHKISGMDKKTYLAQVAKHNKLQKKQEASFKMKSNKDIIFIVIDSVSSGMPSTHGIFTQSTLSWLDTILTNNKNKKVVIFQHVPYMPPYGKETLDILAKNEYRSVIARHKNILAIVSGHYHKDFIQIDNSGVTHICIPSLSEEPYNYGELTIKYDKKLFNKAKNFNIDYKLKPAI